MRVTAEILTGWPLMNRPSQNYSFAYVMHQVTGMHFWVCDIPSGGKQFLVSTTVHTKNEVDNRLRIML
jgi:hypothetical protein